MIRIISVLLTFSLIFGFYSCSSDNDDYNPTTETEVPAIPTVRPMDIDFPTFQNMVRTSIIGRIVDTNDQPIENATITCTSCDDSQTANSDEFGNFSFQEVKNKGPQAFLSVTSPGKFVGYRRFALLENRQNYTSIELRNKKMEGVLSTNNGGVISTSGGAKVTLSQAGILDTDGNVYNGEYNVYMSWIDPTDKALNRVMMGDLSGVDVDGNIMGLSTFGMLQIELESPDGTALNLSGDATAELSFPVPAELMDIAPASIPLWSYDETHGYWVEEGQAQLVGDNYVGNVTHFSTWNVDTKFDAIDLSGEINLISINDTQIGLGYFEIRLSGNSFRSVGGWLCEDGSFSFVNVPSGEELNLEVINYCGEIIESIKLGPYNANTNLPEPIILTDTNGFNEVVIQGNALACNDSPVKNGKIQIQIGNRSYNFQMNDQGQFLFAIRLCSETISKMTILNKDDFSRSTPITLTGLNTNYNLADIKVCEENDEFFYLEIIDYSLNFEATILVVNPEYLWYEMDQNGYRFTAYNPQCWDSNLNGERDPTEDVNMDGKFNLADCNTDEQGEATIAFTQELILNHVAKGVNDDGYLFFFPDGLETNGESYEFLFTEIGEPDASGRPSVIAGSFSGYFIEMDLPISGSFRLKPQ